MSHRVPDAPHEDMLKLLSVGRMADILPLNCNLTLFFDLILKCEFLISNNQSRFIKCSRILTSSVLEGLGLLMDIGLWPAS